MMAVRPKVFKKGGKQRRGRGFSREELKKAGLDPGEALRYHIPADLRRRTAHEENVETVKTFLESKRASKKAAPKRRRKSKS
jgi:large subunit ribosomal protein L13e